MKKGKNFAIDFSFLIKNYPGQWVVLADDEKTVLAAGKTAKQAILKSKKTSKKTPILYRVPSKIEFSISFGDEISI